VYDSGKSIQSVSDPPCSNKRPTHLVIAITLCLRNVYFLRKYGDFLMRSTFRRHCDFYSGTQFPRDMSVSTGRSPTPQRESGPRPAPRPLPIGREDPTPVVTCVGK
jgi:hypothetical protein